MGLFHSAIFTRIILGVLCSGLLMGQVDAMPGAGIVRVANHDVLEVFSIPDLQRNHVSASCPSVGLQHGPNELWFGGIGGLFSYDEAQRRWLDWGGAAGKDPSITRIGGIGSDGTGRMWICYGDNRFAVLDAAQWRDANHLRPANIKSFGSRLIGGSNGKIWFVSPEGLVSFDGSQWAGPFNPSDALIETYNRIDRRNPNPEERRRAESLGVDVPPPALLVNQVASGIEDREACVWLGATIGILKYDQVTARWTVYENHGLFMGASHIWEDRYGRMWFADNNHHLAMYDRRADAWTGYDLEQRFPGEGVYALAVYVDAQGRVMIGSGPGIIILDDMTGEMTPMTVRLGGERLTGITAIIEDAKTRIWVGSCNAIFVMKQ
jgi:streptogramin lyase